jgi:hypothetical protein
MHVPVGVGVAVAVPVAVAVAVAVGVGVRVAVGVGVGVDVAVAVAVGANVAVGVAVGVTVGQTPWIRKSMSLTFPVPVLPMNVLWPVTGSMMYTASLFPGVANKTPSVGRTPRPS